MQQLASLTAAASLCAWTPTYTVGHKKEPTYIFVCNFVKNQLILMQIFLVDLDMNGTCESMKFTHLT